MKITNALKTVTAIVAAMTTVLPIAANAVTRATPKCAKSYHYSEKAAAGTGVNYELSIKYGAKTTTYADAGTVSEDTITWHLKWTIPANNCLLISLTLSADYYDATGNLIAQHRMVDGNPVETQIEYGFNAPTVNQTFTRSCSASAFVWRDAPTNAKRAEYYYEVQVKSLGVQPGENSECFSTDNMEASKS